jgi:hypothetical protein
MTLSPLTIVAATFALIALVLVVYAFKALGRRRYLGGLTRLIVALLALSLGLLSLTISVATQGYVALTREVLAATVTVVPMGPQRFAALVQIPGGETRRFELAGDELYLDAHIVKWHPYANFVGLHTAFELDRIGGRYRLIDHEQQRPRTVYSLKRDRPFGADVFAFAQRYPVLGGIVDAEYGSATFVPADEEVRYAVLVSTTGLLARRLE